jgi:hypothetical protein
MTSGAFVQAKRFFNNGDHTIDFGYVIKVQRYGAVIRFGDGAEEFRYFNSITAA